MLSNYLKIAVRSLIRFKSYTLINLLGLSLGLMAGILIMVYVLDELSFDQFHAKRDRIYRVNTAFFTPGSEPEVANDTNGWPVGKILEKDYPEVEAVLYARFSGLHINQDEKRFRERSFFASQELFDIFSFDLVKGDPKTALKDPYSVVLSESLAAKLFPGQDAFGKTIVMADTINMLVTGIMKNIPAQSHIQSEMFLSFSTYQALVPDFSFDEGWGMINMRNYVLLREGADFNAFAEKSRNIYLERAGEMLKSWGVQSFVPLRCLAGYLPAFQSGEWNGPERKHRQALLAGRHCILCHRAGLYQFHKPWPPPGLYLGPRRLVSERLLAPAGAALVGQFLSESFVLTFLALVLALALVGLLMPTFNQLLDKTYQLGVLTQGTILVGLVILLFGITILAGYYPAWVLSGLRPSQVLSGKMQTGQRGAGVPTLPGSSAVLCLGKPGYRNTCRDRSDYVHGKSKTWGLKREQVLVD